MVAAGLVTWGSIELWVQTAVPLSGSKIVFQTLVRLRNHPDYPMNIIHDYNLNLLSTW